MNQKLFYIALIIIVLSVLFVLFRLIKKSIPEIQTKTETTYFPGKTQQLYKQGKGSITITTKSFHSSATLKSSADDSTYNFTSGDSSYKLSLNIQTSADSSLSLEYFLDITTKDIARIDTIFLSRIDTLKIKDTITIKQDPPFYNTFLFGAVITSTVILLLTILLR